jgi:hypothetical protein
VMLGGRPVRHGRLFMMISCFAVSRFGHGCSFVEHPSSHQPTTCRGGGLHDVSSRRNDRSTVHGGFRRQTRERSASAPLESARRRGRRCQTLDQAAPSSHVREIAGPPGAPRLVRDTPGPATRAGGKVGCRFHVAAHSARDPPEKRRALRWFRQTTTKSSSVALTGRLKTVTRSLPHILPVRVSPCPACR